MKTYLMTLVILLSLGLMAGAQDISPVSTTPSFGFSLPSVEGTLNYSLSAAELIQTGYGSGPDESTTVSGSLGYLSSSPTKPFSLVYSGGYIYSSIPGYPASSTFQNLAVSQVVTTKNWNFVVDDAVSYLPEAPTTGLSGIPGVGDIGVIPVQIGDEPGQSILTNYATRVANGLNGGATRRITSSWSINGSASWQVLHFFGGEGINSTTETGSVGPSYRIDARSSASAVAVYSYTSDSFAGQTYPFESEGVTFQYQRQLSRFFTVNLSAGPQRTFGSGATSALIPSQVTAVGAAALTYNRRNTTASINFSRATNSGSGVVYGGLSDTLAGAVRQQFSRNWQGSLTASYSRTSALGRIPGFDYTYQATYGGGQVSRRFGRLFSGYFSYTAVTQAGTTAGVAGTALRGLSQTFAVGATYSPGAQHPGKF